MAFEFWFSLFGLISSDSKWRHKSRIDSDWRLFTPLNASLFRDAGQKSPVSSGGTPVSINSSGIFSTTGTLAAAGNTAGDGVFSSTSVSSSSASSITSSLSGSTATLIKPSLGGSGGYNSMSSSSPVGGVKPHQLDSFLDKQQAKQAEAGLDATNMDGADLDSESTGAIKGKRAGSIYCRVVCLCLWLHVLRLLAGLIVERSIVTLDFYYLGAYRIHFLIPALCLAVQVAAVSLIFIRNNEETNWLVPFYSSKDYLIRSRSNFRPKMEEYTKRVNISIVLALLLALTSSISLSAYLVHCVMQSPAMQGITWLAGSMETDSPMSMPPATTSTTTTATTTISSSSSSSSSGNDAGAQVAMDMMTERTVLTVLLVYDILWAVYATHICFLVAFYFNLICSIMKSRFHGISKIIEDLAESNTTKTTNQARKITTLYLEHNEACELLDESNDFWQYLIFFTYFTYIPAYCYCLYNLFFVDFEAWPSFITWVIHTHTGFIILLISFSAAGVSTEAHAPYTSLHTLSLIQLPLDVEVNIATFLHRVRGLTIGYSCYDLFAITNGSMSNTAAACASYFLIVADFNRSSVFTAQMNSSAVAAGASMVPALTNTAMPALSTR